MPEIKSEIEQIIYKDYVIATENSSWTPNKFRITPVASSIVMSNGDGNNTI